MLGSGSAYIMQSVSDVVFLVQIDYLGGHCGVLLLGWLHYAVSVRVFPALLYYECREQQLNREKCFFIFYL